ncbi:hypothetical protein GGTG_10132 [Gaeumannomyces tritici R3-111a-1]|uniref:Uncharacterized protein n=1 Tax=Gaeumannomyces tritici (strain R3-111a-1) TaxID=644352 RepID=J3P9F1_GAET3|nr:hypothetical protein GGTG_10132 [Gaeumannomyces tritici R3-111a-1]EJT73287.1 hypothetical protein GGTG_10132 [Gaeumannomyces tritici R3-111a-1]
MDTLAGCISASISLPTSCSLGTPGSKKTEHFSIFARACSGLVGEMELKKPSRVSLTRISGPCLALVRIIIHCNLMSRSWSWNDGAKRCGWNLGRPRRLPASTAQGWHPPSE